MLTDRVGPENTGGLIRQAAVARALADLGELHVVVTNGAELRDFGDLAQVARSTHTQPIGRLPRFRSLRSSLRHPTIPWRVVCHDIEAARPIFAEMIEEIRPDLIWTSSIAVWLTLAESTQRQCVVDLSDQRSVLHRETARIILRRWGRRLRGRYLSVGNSESVAHPVPLDGPWKLAKELESMGRWSIFEHRLSRGSLATVTCNSTESARHSRCHSNHWIIPNGFRLLDPPSKTGSDFAGFVLPASFGHPPNVDGAEWFVEAVLPKLRKRLPNANVTFAGSCPTSLHEYEAVADIKVTGPVVSMDQILVPGTVVISPVLGGSGTRLKILEAWARGLPVVSTSKGVEGLGAVDGTDVLIADDPDSFAEHCAALAASPRLRQSLGIAGYNRLTATLSWHQVGRQIEHHLREVLSSDSAPHVPTDSSEPDNLAKID